MSSGCAFGRPSSSPPAVGDSCLVGGWTLEHEENRSGYSYAGTPVSVAGLHGAKLHVTADGTESEIFDGSDPLVGNIADGRELSITLGGSFEFHLHADGHNYVETGTRTALRSAATVAGVTIPDFQSAYIPARGTYQCSRQTLITVTSSGVQTDTWSRT